MKHPRTLLTVSFFGVYSIVVGGDCVVSGCHSSQNTYGIYVLNGSGCRIEGNEVRDNSNTGIFAGASDIILRNAAGGNPTNYSPSSGVNFAPIQSLSTITNPAANIAC